MEIDPKRFFDSLGGPEGRRRHGLAKRKPTPWNPT